MLGAFSGGIQVLQAEGGGAVKAGRTDEVGFVAVEPCQFPGALSKRKSAFGIAEPEEALGEVGLHGALPLLMVFRNPSFQGTFEGNFRAVAKAAEG